ncbi:dynamin family protein [Saccharopolyspora sp. HNM0983]|uniref:Dynamin family protein n=1 Tax=Saccharopolyspora montiporae TaxID=2781240 RepID=A0A929FXH1_9PSEU|nr:dynamin family protein [Saccharopolyspora sp. HNM0983]MBE9374676.1 dynamin family protein [Saccharopolyspora sp. HNM0983]
MCTDLRPQLAEPTADRFDDVLRRLAAPLQVAVAGRIKSGKSTLVNALIGRRVAPTDIGECTRLVTRFQYGTVDRIEVVLTDGTRQAVPFAPDGGIPAELGMELSEVSHLEAYLTNAVLRELTVIDTPGLGSLDADAAGRTADLLGEIDPVSSSALAGAEAVLYVLTQQVRADDRSALSAFSAATGGSEAGPVNAIALLNKADTVQPESVTGAGSDVWAAAGILAQRQARLLQPRVADVLPVVGLLAESAETGAFTAADAAALRELSGLDTATRETLLLSADLFTTWECGVDPAVRTGLLHRLDLHGVRCALAAIEEDPQVTDGALRRALRDASGLAAVQQRLRSVLQARVDGIKAAAALASVTALAEEPGAAGDPGAADQRQRVHDAVEALLARPEAHRLRVLEALTAIASGAVELPDDLAEEVLRVGSGGDAREQLGMPDGGDQDMAGYALERATWWRSFSSLGATPAQSRIAHVVHRAYFLLWQQLGASA